MAVGSVANRGNKRVGHRSRRGDGTFGESVPDTDLESVEGFVVRRGPIASVEIACEVKILNKAMIKQIDRVIGDLRKQVEEFRSGNDRPITVAVVGINRAVRTHGYEGDRVKATDGGKHKHPSQEADEAERRVLEAISTFYDEDLIVRFRATNAAPFPFEWVDHGELKTRYATLLARACRRYEATG